MKNKNYLMIKLWASLAVLFLAGCASPFLHTITGSGDPGTEVRGISGADRILLEGAGEIILIQGDQESVRITTDHNLLPYVETLVEGSTLRLGFRRGMSFQSSLGIRMVVTLKDVASVGLTGTGSIRGEGLVLSALQVELEGTGDLVLSGSAGRLDAFLSGTGSIVTTDFRTEEVSVSLTGMGNAEVWAGKSLDARISGVGHILYSGNPGVVKSVVTGLGSVRKK